jgi:hypothetical protein
MTSLAALKDWLVAGKTIGKTGDMEGGARLRPLPKEEICLYVKQIDNRGVVRLVDEKDWAANISMTGGILLASFLLVLLLLPGGYSLAAGRRIEQLKQQRAELLNELRAVRAQEAALTAPDKIIEYAGTGFVDPSAAEVVFAPPSRGTVASLNQR